MAGTIDKNRKVKSVQVKILDYLQSRRAELLIVVLALIAAAIIALKMWDRLSTGLVVRDAASELADVLRESRAVAGERHIFVTVSVVAATTRRGCSARVSQGSSELTSLDLPSGVSSEGTITFSPYGIPGEARTFSVRKGTCALTIVVNKQGLITIPAP